jgi:hypothetical protein
MNCSGIWFELYHCSRTLEPGKYFPIPIPGPVSLEAMLGFCWTGLDLWECGRLDVQSCIGVHPWLGGGILWLRREHCSIHRIVYIENVFRVPNSGIKINRSVSWIHKSLYLKHLHTVSAWYDVIPATRNRKHSPVRLFNPVRPISYCTFPQV